MLRLPFRQRDAARHLRSLRAGVAIEPPAEGWTPARCMELAAVANALCLQSVLDELLRHRRDDLHAEHAEADEERLSLDYAAATAGMFTAAAAIVRGKYAEEFDDRPVVDVVVTMPHETLDGDAVAISYVVTPLRQIVAIVEHEG